MIGLTPFEVGLAGMGGISARFGEMRNGCPHKGLDIRSSGTPTPFTAGIFGKVVFVGGAYGTVAVRPRDGSATWVQYLHCSDTSVVVGDDVYPWTVLGKTGDTAPPGTNISGIHLHIQVQVPGSGQTCWATSSGNPRNFADPQTYATRNFIDGTWSTTRHYSAPGGQFVETDELRIFSSEIKGVSFFHTRRRELTILQTGCKLTAEFAWVPRITGFSGNKVLFSAPAGTASLTQDTCGLNWKPSADAGSGDLELLDDNRLRYMSYNMQRVGLSRVDLSSVGQHEFCDEISEQSFTDGSLDPYENQQDQVLRMKSISDLDWLNGVATDEVF
ncbi:M23 family metallopeptidase [Rhodovulum sp. FJ3]|uniref:M23 family metallopeptidase n=1 Tax=Rhodovulum sp. FJ3 TaxID=3079053 RepID=UPI00293DFDC0|nr:M23 family metallopeptidase [Rhodovulum sp. FJ3]MDV4169690.1 M23 family metallopeptidase [Rhodovulum sp. FJ3]